MERQVDVPEVFAHDCVAAGEVDGPLELVLALVQPSQPVIQPPEGIDEGTIVRIEPQRLLDEVRGLAEATAVIGQQLAEEIERPRIRGSQSQCVARRRLGAGRIPTRLAHGRELEDDLDVSRMAA